MWIHAEAIGAIDILQNQVYFNFFMTRGKRRRPRGKMGLIMRLEHICCLNVCSVMTWTKVMLFVFGSLFYLSEKIC